MEKLLFSLIQQSLNRPNNNNRVNLRHFFGTKEDLKRSSIITSKIIASRFFRAFLSFSKSKTCRSELVKSKMYFQNLRACICPLSSPYLRKHNKLNISQCPNLISFKIEHGIDISYEQPQDSLV